MTDEPDSPTIDIDITLLDSRWREELPEAEAIVCRAVAAAWRATPAMLRGPAAAEISIALASDDLLRELNRKYRGRDKATNVLAFPAGEDATGGAVRMLGDVVLAREILLAEAVDQGKRVGDHLTHLVVHGLLHLLGFDHQQERDAVAMESLESKILVGLGIADPYRVRPQQPGALQ